MNRLTRFTSKAHHTDHVCFRCKKQFNDGDWIVRTEGNGKHFVRHRECFTDAKGNPIL